MLRITRSIQEGAVWLKLEGKLAADWVAECRAICAAELQSACAPALDLSDVSFVDGAGAELLRELTRAGFRCPRRSNFVAELMGWEQP